MKSKNRNKLELYIAGKLKTRPTKGSGAFKEIGDIYSDYYFIECKEKHTKNNFILTRKEWLKLQSGMPLNTNKIPFWVIENKHSEKVVILNEDDFFRLIGNNILTFRKPITIADGTQGMRRGE